MQYHAIHIIIIIVGSVKYYHNDIQCISISVKKNWKCLTPNSSIPNSNFNSIPSSNFDSNSSNRETTIACGLFLAFHRSKLTVIVIAPRLEFYSECKLKCSLCVTT